MLIVAYVIGGLVALAAGTCTLVFALWLLAERDTNPLTELGVGQC